MDISSARLVPARAGLNSRSTKPSSGGGIAGVSVQALVDPVTGEPKRLCDLPADVAYCLEAYELDEQGRIVKAKMYSKIDALKFLSKHLQLAQDVPDVLVQPMTLNHTEVILASLSTEELRVIQRVLLAQQCTEDAKALAGPSTAAIVE
jgi:hypothetical protein